MSKERRTQRVTVGERGEGVDEGRGEWKVEGGTRGQQKEGLTQGDTAL